MRCDMCTRGCSSQRSVSVARHFNTSRHRFAQPSSSLLHQRFPQHSPAIAAKDEHDMSMSLQKQTDLLSPMAVAVPLRVVLAVSTMLTELIRNNIIIGATHEPELSRPGQNKKCTLARRLQ